MEESINQILQYLETIRIIKRSVVPTSRGLDWFNLSGAATLQIRFPDMYDTLKSRYEVCPVLDQIQKDVPRTNRSEEFWTEENALENQQRLLQVLAAYALYFPQIGFCQGMACVAAMLLNELNEERAFWVLVSLTVDAKYRLDGVWHRLTLAQEMFLNMEKAMEHCLPRLASHFQSQGIVADMYGIMTTSWFITVFIASKLPMRIVLSIWDQYLEHGIPFIYQSALSIFKTYESGLLKKDFSEILTVFVSSANKTMQCMEFSEEEFIHQCHEFQVPNFEYKTKQLTLDELRMSPI